MSPDQSTPPRCPLCVDALLRVDRPTRIMNGRAQWAYKCACGVIAWAMKSQTDGSLFVATFTPNRKITVRRVNPGEACG